MNNALQTTACLEFPTPAGLSLRQSRVGAASPGDGSPGLRSTIVAVSGRVTGQYVVGPILYGPWFDPLLEFLMRTFMAAGYIGCLQ